MEVSNTFWNRFAAVYDLATRAGDHGLMDAATYIGGFLKPTDIVLDAACGTGAFACALAPRVGFMAACDFAPNMLARARSKAQRIGVPDETIGFGAGDITALEFEDDTFDAAIAGNVLHLLDDPTIAVAELRRVVKPDGIIAIPNYVNAEAVDRRFLGIIEAFGFSARHEWDEAALLAFLDEAGLDVLDRRSFEAKQPLCVAICAAHSE